MQNLVPLLKINLKLASFKPVLYAILYLLFVPVINGISNLEAKYVAELLEKFISPVGVILFVPLCSPEENNMVKESVYIKPFAYEKIIGFRIMASVMILMVLLSFVTRVLVACHCEFPVAGYMAGTMVTAMVTGCVGLSVALTSNNTALGYFVAASYVLLNWSGIIDKSNSLYLFSLIDNQFQQKKMLFIIACTCIIYNITLLKWRKVNIDRF